MNELSSKVITLRTPCQNISRGFEDMTKDQMNEVLRTWLKIRWMNFLQRSWLWGHLARTSAEVLGMLLVSWAWMYFWINNNLLHLYSAFLDTQRALHSKGTISSSTTNVQHPPGWWDGSHSAPERPPHTSLLVERRPSDEANQCMGMISDEANQCLGMISDEANQCMGMISDEANQCMGMISDEANQCMGMISDEANQCMGMIRRPWWSEASGLVWPGCRGNTSLFRRTSWDFYWP